jgi:hypothetical protein
MMVATGYCRKRSHCNPDGDCYQHRLNVADRGDAEIQCYRTPQQHKEKSTDKKAWYSCQNSKIAETKFDLLFSF